MSLLHVLSKADVFKVQSLNGSSTHLFIERCLREFVGPLGRALRRQHSSSAFLFIIHHSSFCIPH
jgi:hypothetical protein